MIECLDDNTSTKQRRSVRLRGYDYSQVGTYYVTLCTQDRKCILADIVADEVLLSDTGKIVSESWECVATRYEYVELDQFVVMPNHLHGILFIGRSGELSRTTGGSRTAPTWYRKPLGGLIGAFKTVSTKQINIVKSSPGSVLWQRNYWEHIIRDEEDLNRIQTYIQINPAKWSLDTLNPVVVGAV